MDILKNLIPIFKSTYKNLQYQKEKYSLGSLYPSSDKFPVKKGEIIGYTGDTGGSGGPHLHYEIRNSATSKVINPMHFGILPKDTKAPTIKKLIAYPLNNNSRINNAALKTILSFKKIEEGKYVSEKITASGAIGFGISVFDRLDEALNKNGIYSLEMKVNGSRVYYHDVETFSFAESKYINLLIDYKHYKKYKNKVQKTHKVNANRLNLYENLVDKRKYYYREWS